MRSIFSHYYRPSEKEFQQIWRKGIVAVDANVLLDVYRYSSETTEDLLRTLSELNDRLWAPHQACEEYHRSLEKVIASQGKPYDEARDQAQKLLSLLTKPSRHPFVPQDELEEFRSIIEKIDASLTKGKERLETMITDNPLKDRVALIFQDRVGDPLPDEELQEVIRSGVERYERELPPGYKDKEKPESERYGDLIIWHQLMREAKERQCPLLFVTADSKEDWFAGVGGKTLGPRPELSKEFREVTGQLFYIYTVQNFLEYASRFLKAQVRPETLEEIEHFDGRQDLGALLRSGDPRAMNEIVHRYYKVLYNYVESRLGDPEVAGPIVQDLMLRLPAKVQQLEPAKVQQLEPGTDFEKWLLEEAQKMISAHLRRQRIFSTVKVLQSKGQSGRDEVLNKLPVLQKAVLLLSTDEGRSSEEISASLGISVDEVDALLVSARRNLFRLLDGQEPDA